MKDRKKRKAELPPLFEQMEPRLLFSAGLESALATDQPAAPTDIYKQTVLEQSLEWGLAESRENRVEETRVEVIFVDTDTPQYQSLLSDLLRYPDDTTTFEVFELDNTQDGIGQITSILDGFDNVSAIHILSHGSEGSIDLGGGTLDSDTLAAGADQVESWGSAFAEGGDILIYGCNLAADESGRELVNSLAAMTGTDVAASDDLTGSTALGGDWELEYHVGQVNAALSAGHAGYSGWSGTLDTTEAAASYLTTPLAFEANIGQTDAEVDFMARGSGYSVFLTDGDAVLALRSADSGHAIRLDLVGANSNATVSGEDLLDSYSNYLIGNDETTWQSSVENHAAVLYTEVYNGIDVRYYGNQRQFEYDFVVAAGADAGQIKLDFEGVTAVSLADNGDLQLELNAEGQQISFKAPVAFQYAEDGSREAVTSEYLLHDDGSLGFTLGEYDADRTLVIDPILSWASYFGGTGNDVIKDMAIDGAGNIYVTGDSTVATTLPITAGPFGITGAQDAFVAKFSNDGSTLLYSTYFGGSLMDTASGIVVDAAGDIYIAGTTASNDFPAINGNDITLSGGVDAYLAKINAAGTGIVYGSYLGGSGTNGESVGGIALDPSGAGRVVIAGSTDSNDLPTSNAYDTTLGGTYDGIIAAYDTTQTGAASLLYSSYFGGSNGGGGTGNDSIRALDVDALGNIYITGHTSATSQFPLTANAYDATTPTSNDAYVTKLLWNGGASWSTLYSSYIGSNVIGSSEYGEAITADAAGYIYVAGKVSSSGFPTKNAYDTTANGGSDVFIAKFDPGAALAPDTLVYSTYFGGSGTDNVYDLAVDSSGNVYATGSTSSVNLPLTVDAHDSILNGATDAFVITLGAGGNTLDYSTYLGGNGSETAYALALDASDNIYIAGSTTSVTGLATAGAFDTTFNGASDGFVAKMLANRDPVATDNAYTTGEGVAVGGNVITDDTGAGIDSDPDLDPLTASLVDGPLHGTLVLNADGTFIYTPFDAPTTNFADTDTFTYQVNDGNGGTDTATVTITVTPDASNEAPVNSVPGAQTTGQDIPLVFSGTNGNRITVRDDAGGNTIEVTLTATNGIVTLAGTTGLAITGGADGTATVTVQGTITDLNNAINGVSFTPTPAYLGSASLQIDTDDLGNAPVAAPQTDTDIISIDVQAINDAPVNSVPGAQNFDQDGMLLFSSTTGTAISVSDADAAGNSIEVTLTATNGTLNLSGDNGLSFTVGDGTDDPVMTFTGTIADINAALQGATFIATAGYNGSASVQITTDDLGNTGTGGAKSDTDTINITVDPAEQKLWFTFENDEGDTGNSDIPSITGGDVVTFGGSMNFEPGTTSGTFSYQFNLDSITGSDGNTRVDAVHYVSQDIQVGTNNIQLYTGDLLLSTDGDETIDGVDYKKEDVFVFRPSTAGDYSAGSFFRLIDGKNDTGWGSVSGISLVEKTTVVGTGAGAVTLNPGDFLLAHDGDAKHVHRFVPGSLGDTTTGTTTLLIDAGDIDIGKDIGGIHLVQTDTEIGGFTLSAGQMLLSLMGDDNDVGDTPTIVVKRQDVFVLDVTSTGSGTTAATATRFFEGLDENLDKNQESIWGISYQGNAAPVVSDTSFSIDENSPNSTVVDTVSASDPEGDPINYAITAGNSGGAFSIDANTGVITVSNSAMLDFETTPVFTLTVAAMDDKGAYNTATITINLNDVNEAPTAADDAYTVDEDQTLIVTSTTANVVGSWQFDEGAGSQTVADDSGSGSDGTLGPTTAIEASDPSWISPDRSSGAALDFDGIDDYVQTTSADLQTATEFTLSAWFKPDVTTGQHHILWQGIGTLNGWGTGGGTAADSAEMHLTVGHWAQDNKISFFMGWDEADPNSIDIISSSDFTDTTIWHHASVVVTDIGGGFVQADLYVDGVLEGSDTGNQVDRSSWNTDLRIGAPGAATRFFDGMIDAVQIYDSPLSAAEVAELWQPGVLANDTDVEGNTLDALLVAGPANGSVTLNLDGSFSYTPDVDFYGTDTFTYKANDGVNDSNVATVTITVNPVNDASALAAIEVPALAYSENDPATPVTTSITVADVDDTNIESASIAISGNYQNGQDILDFTDFSNITGAWDAATGIMTLTGADTLANYQLALRAVTYRNTSEEPSELTRTVSFTVNDGSVNSNTVTRDIDVTSVNDQPAVSNVAIAATEDGSTVNGSFIVSDADSGDAHTFNITGSPSEGSVVNNNDGTFTFDPGSDFQDLALGETRGVTFTYTATDDSGAANATSVNATVTVTVTGTNDQPTVSNVAVAATEDGATVNGSFVVSDADTTDTHTFNITGSPSEGSVVNNNDGTFTFDPGSDFQDLALGETRDVTFTYTATDDSGAANATSAAATVTVTVTGTNDQPTVSNVAVAATEDGATVNGSFVISDADTTDTHTFSITGSPSEGSVVNNNDGTFTFDPGSDFQNLALGETRDVTFTYTATDDSGAANATSANATVTVTVTGTNDQPTVSNVAVAATEDGATVNGSFVVNDDDTSDTHTFNITGSPSEGSVVNNNDGTFTFDPGTDFQDLALGETRDVTFTYTATDDSGAANATSTAATVTVTVTGTNDQPTVSNVAIAATEDGATVNGSFAVSDADTTDTHTFNITGSPSEGSVVNNNDGTFTFDPGSDFQDLALGETRDVTFTYTATDDSGAANATSINATVTVTVTGTNDQPTVSNVAVAATEDGATVNGSFVVSDADTTDTHTFNLTGSPSEGSVVNNNDGTFTFDPGSDFQDLALGETRDVTFTYTATDDSGAANATSAAATVTVTVTGTNDQPTVSNVAIAATEDGATVNGSFVVNDDDTSDTHTFNITGSPSEGSVVNNNDGTFTFDPGSDFQDLALGETRDVTFTYTATDDSGAANATSANATVTVTVTGTNDQPTVSNVAVNATEDGATVNGSFNVSDADTTDTHTFNLTGSPSEGSVINNNDGTFTFDPGSDFQDLALGETRDVTFTYTATDDSGAANATSANATVTVTVTGTNDQPTVSNVAISATEDGATVNGSFVVSDADTTDTHTFNITGSPSEGSVVNNNDGTFTFDPGSDFQDLALGETRDVTFTYTATDDSGAANATSANATVTVTVTGTNDQPTVSNVAVAATEDGATVNGSFAVSDADTTDTHTFNLTSSPSEGSVINNNDGTFTFDPGSDFQNLALGETRDVTFTYTATDDSGAANATSANATVTVTVTGTNDQPTVSNVAVAATEDGATVNGSFVVSDADTTDTHTFNITGSPSEGSVVNNNDGTFTFDPGSDFQDLALGETRDVTFTYTTTDDSGAANATSTAATVTVTVTGTNDQPTVSNVAIAATEDGATVNGSFVVSDADTTDTHTFNITGSPSEGSVVNNNDGTFTFDPGSDFQDLALGETRDVTFTYTATDDSGAANATSANATVTVTVTGTNDQPTVSNVAVAATEDGATVNGSFVVSDADTTDTHTFNITGSPSEGSVVNNNDGTFTFDPGSDFQDLALGETRDVTFTYTATDDSGAANATSAAATVTVTVTGTNDQPTVSNVAIAATEDGATVNGSFVVNDDDTSDTHTFNITGSPSEGSVVNNNDGTFTFDPGSDFQDLALGETRDVTFTYTATDDSGAANATSANATVTVTVTGTNDQPTVSNVAVNATEDGSSVNGSFVVSDADTTDTHTFSITASPSEGSVVNNNDGTFTFDPGSDFQDLALGETRDVTFTYSATDDSGAANATSAAATVTVTVTGTNDQPTVSNVAIAATEDGATVNGSFVVNDDDTSDTHTFTITGSPSEGSVVNNNDGTFTFDPGSDFQDLALGETRDVTFTYTATDDSGAANATSAAATVTVTVTGTNDQPTVSNVAIAATEDGATVNGSFAVSDADTTDTHSFNITGSPSEGSVVNNNDGTFTFDPGSDFQDLALGETRDVTFTYTATDDSGAANATSANATVTVTVTGTNDQPTVSNVAVNATEDGATVNGSFVVNDDDTSDTHTFTITGTPSEGSVVNNNDGTFTFDPEADFQDLALGETRDVTFTYTATDDSGAVNATSAAATVTVTVTGTNDQPTVSNVAIASTEDGATVNGSFAVSDADATDTHAFNITGSPSEGSVVNNNDGTFTFDPGSDFQDLALGETRDVTFTYTATDDSGAVNATSAAAIVTVTVTGTNDQPAVSNVAINATEDGSTVNGSFNVSDADTTDTHTFNLTGSPSEGSVVNNNDGTFTFDPGSDFQDLALGETRDVTFTYTATDDSGAANATSAAATVTVTVTGTNDQPTVSNVAVAATEDGATVNGSFAVSDADATDTHTFTITGSPSEGSVVNNNDGTFTFDPGSDFQDLALGETRDVTFTYTATDDSGAANATSTAATVTVTVTGTNDQPTVSNVAVNATEDGATVNGSFVVNDDDTSDTHTFTITGTPSEGSVVNNNDGTFTFDPGSDFQDLALGETRDVTFTYTATDDSGAANATSAAATVTVTVTGTNDQPTVSNVAIAATEDGATVNGSFAVSDADTTDTHTFNITGSPSEGSVVNNNDGTFTFDPGSDFQDLALGETRDVTFTYTATDDSGAANATSTSATVTVTVTGTNDQPTVSNVAVAATEDGATVNGSFAVSDADTTDTHTFNITGSPSEGSVVNNNDGSFSFDPGSDFQDLALGETRDVTFTYTATDDSGAANATSVNATVTVTVTGTNDQPTVSNIAVNATEDGATVNGSFMVSDADTTDTHAFNLTGSPSEGSVVNNNDGTFTFDPGTDFQDLALGETRDVTFTYTTTDDSGAANATSTAATVTVTVTGTNDQPTVSNVAINATEDGATVNGSFVVSDADTTDTHTFNITGSPSEGSVVNNNDGTFTFDPGSDFQDLALGETRDVTFTYTATDDSGAANATSTAATVTVTVTGTNDQPTVSNIAINATANGSTTDGTFAVSDADTTDGHSFDITSSPSEGSVVNNNDGTFTFDPGTDFDDLALGETRDVTFNYTATDDSGAANATSTSDTVTVTVTGVNSQPIVSNVAINATEDGATVNGSFNVSDTDTTDTHTFDITSSPGEGSVTNNNDGTFTFDPGSDFQDLALGETRDVTFTYTATDDSGAANATSANATVTVTVTGTNDQPTVSNVAVNATEDGATVNGSFNVSDADTTDTHTFNLTGSPSEGSVINNNDGTFTFDPGSDFQDLALGETRDVTFTYTATDDSGAANATSANATVTVTVTGTNDQPTVSNVAISATEDGATVNGSFVVSDADTTDTHTFNITGSPSEGSVVNNNDGTFTFDPGSDFQDLALGETRDVTFTYTATDDSGAANATSANATVTVTVTGTNDQPTVSNVAVAATEDGATVNGSFAVSDADTTDTHTFNLTSSPSEGSVINNNDGTFTFDPGSDFQNLALGETRDVTFTYTATDDSGAANATSVAATVTVTVTGTNDQPTVSNVTVSATEDGATVNGSFVVSDADTTDTHTFNITGSPSEGSVVNNNDGTFTFDPGSDFQDLALGETRDVTFTYTATDDSGAANATSTAATVTITVTGTNDQPTVSNVAIAATEDGATVNGSFVVSDADTTDTHTFNLTGSPSEGSVVNNNDGTFTFDPGADFQDLALGETRDVTFTYTATDDSGAANATSANATVTVTVTGTNDQPTVSNVAVNSTEDGATVNGSFMVSDADTTDTHTFNITGSPSEGSVVNNNDGTFTFDPGSDFQDLALGETRDVTFTYTTTDDSGAANATSTSATVTVTVTGTNDQPTVSNVAIAATEDGATVNGSFAVSDADATDTHTFNITGSPSEGSVVNNNDGTFTFDPGSDFQDLALGETRDVTFTYTATDDSGAANATSVNATVTVTVTGTNDQPTVSNVAVNATEDGATVNGSFVLSDADATDTHTFNITGSPSEGSVVNNNDGTFSFDPGSDFQDLALGETRDVTFTYTATDDSGAANATSTAATVTVTVTGTNDQPTVSNVAIAATEDGATVNGSFNVSDTDTTDTHTFDITSSPSEGSVVNNNDGTFTFNPGSDFQDLALGETRDVTFTYTATDDSGAANATSAAATVTVTVTGTNDQPTVSNVAIAATEDGATVNGSFVVSDADTTNTHTFNITGSPSEGSVVNNNDGTFTFDPGSDFQDLALGETRDVTFTYTATDDSGAANATSAAATVTVTVTGTNDQPTVSNVAINATEDGATVNGSFAVSDADTTDTHTFNITGSPSEGSVVNNNDGTFTFDPGSDFQDLALGETRDVTFTYTATDDSGAANATSTAATVTVTITGTNDQPTVSNVAIAATEDGATVNGSFNVSDTDTTDTHTFDITSSPSEGSVVNNNDGTFTFNPGSDFQDLALGETRDVTFTYTATDDSGAANATSAAATVTVTVTGTNDQPTVSNVTIAATEDGATVNGSFVVSDADTTNTHTFNITGSPSEGSVVNNNDGTFTFDPGSDFQDLALGETRDVTFTYTATDDSGAANATSAAANVTVTVTGTNDQPTVSNVAISATEDGATVNGSFVVSDADTTDTHTFNIIGSPSEGSVVNNNDGTFTFDPGSDFQDLALGETRDATFTYTATDDSGAANATSAAATVTVTVTGTNDQPTVSNVAIAATEDGTTVNGSFVVSDADTTDTHTFNITGSPSEGSVVNNNDGTFTFDPGSDFQDLALGETRDVTFTYTATDDSGAANATSAAATVTVTVTGTNDQPTVSNVAINATEDGATVNGSFAVSDDDTTDTHTFNITGSPSEGSVVNNNDGTFTFDPGSDFQDLALGETRDVTFTYTATDDSGAANATSANATVTVTVTGTNDQPTVSNVAVNATEDGSTVNGSFAVSDADTTDTHTFNITGSPSEGSVVNNNDGTFTFDPGADFQDLALGETRDVTFTYTATDDSGAANATSAAANVTVTVTGTNDQPTVSNVAIAATEDGATVNGSFVVSDADTTDTHTFNITGSPSEGSVVNNNDGTFTFDPGADFQDLALGETRDVTFTYTATDDSGAANATSATATVTVTVTGTNDQPTVSNVAIAATEDGATVNGSFVVSDADTTDTHTFNITSSPSEGSVVNNNDGTFTFDPGADFQDLALGETRDVTFTYTATDDSGAANATSAAANVTVTVTGTNDQPTVSNVAIAATEDGATVNGSFAVSDADTTDTHTFNITGSPSEGSVVNNNDGTFTFDPGSDFQDLALGETRDVTFTYTATDDSGAANATSATATVTVTVTGTNDQPTVSNVAIAATEDGATVNGSFAVSDADTTDTHTFNITSSPSEGSVVNNNDGTFTFDPGSDFQDLALGETRDVTFTYTATDDSGAANATSAAATVTVTVTGTNDQPTVSNVAVNATEDGSIVNGSFNVSDADTTDTHTFNITGSPSEGSVVNNNDGTFTFDPGADFQDLALGETRDVTFTYTATDDSGAANAASSSATVTVTVTGTNDRPAAGSVTINANEDGASVNGSFIFSDLDTTDSHSIDITSPPIEGSVINNNDGSFTFDPGADFQDLAQGETRDVTFTYTVTDDSGAGNATSFDAIVTVTVTGTNDTPVATDNSYNVDENTSFSGNVLADNTGSGVDSDIDGDALTASLLSDVSNGVLALNPDGSFTYTPDTGYSGTDTFTYFVNDGMANSSSVTVTLTVADTIPPEIPPPGPGPEPEEEPGPPPVSEIIDIDDPIAVPEKPVDIVKVQSGIKLSEANSPDGLLNDINESTTDNYTLYTELRQNIDTQKHDLPTSLELWQMIDIMKQQINDSQYGDEGYLMLIAKSANGMALSLTAGIVTWALRGGSLLASMMSSVPLWRGFDPLPIISRTRRDEDDENDSTDNLFDSKDDNAGDGQ